MPQLFAILELIHAAEGLWNTVSGAGASKKATVIGAVGTLVDDANKAGAQIDKDVVVAVMSPFVDAYVGLQNVLGWKAPIGNK
ncbi:MAG TPA: hypothetical protein VJT32_09200 [bacterium]|nr:hypothetical protein [bacterium]